MSIKGAAKLIGRVFVYSSHITSMADEVHKSVMRTQLLIDDASKLLDGATEAEIQDAKSTLEAAIKQADRTIRCLAFLRNIIER